MSDPKKPLDRFQHLERERSAELKEQVAPSAASRFGAVEQAAPAPSSVPAGTSSARFQAPTGPEEVLLEQNGDAEQPFVKCAACGAEWGKFAQFCGGCGASFDTEEQRALNAQVWAERKAQLQSEQATLSHREAARMAEAQHQAQVRHGDAQAIAEDARRRAEAQLEFERTLAQRGLGMAPGRVSWTGLMDRSPLLALVGLAPEPWSWLIGGALVMIPLGLIKWAHHGGHAWWAGVFWLIADVALLLPPSLWLSRRRWYDDW